MLTVASFHPWDAALASVAGRVADFQKIRAIQGRVRASRVPRSPNQGSITKPDASGPTTQPVILIAYPFPARSGLPEETRSRIIGVTNPTIKEKGRMLTTRRV